jgi:hypothetical protein
MELPLDDHALMYYMYVCFVVCLAINPASAQRFLSLSVVPFCTAAHCLCVVVDCGTHLSVGCIHVVAAMFVSPESCGANLKMCGTMGRVGGALSRHAACLVRVGWHKYGHGANLGPSLFSLYIC